MMFALSEACWDVAKNVAGARYAKAVDPNSEVHLGIGCKKGLLKSGIAGRNH